MLSIPTTCTNDTRERNRRRLRKISLKDTKVLTMRASIAGLRTGKVSKDRKSRAPAPIQMTTTMMVVR